MNLAGLEADLFDTISDGMKELDIDEESIDFWEVSDYGIFVLLTERFYSTLKYRSASPADFILRKKGGNLIHKDSYADSRTITKPIVDHFNNLKLRPHVLDVGGYIGRFSIETALLCKEQNINLPIYCLEPGLTGNIIRANLKVNEVQQYVSLQNVAASDVDGTADYKYAPDVLISGRICSFPSASKHRTVNTVRLDTFINNLGNVESAIIKIDTEGHEPNVMSGLGDIINNIPAVYIIEFWPDTLKEYVNGVAYADFIENNFIVINIRSSLYPAYYEKINDIRQFAQDFDIEEGNVDLLFISRNLPGASKLEDTLLSLA